MCSLNVSRHCLLAYHTIFAFNLGSLPNFENRGCVTVNFPYGSPTVRMALQESKNGYTLNHDFQSSVIRISGEIDTSFNLLDRTCRECFGSIVKRICRKFKGNTHCTIMYKLRKHYLGSNPNTKAHHRSRKMVFSVFSCMFILSRESDKAL